METLPRIDLAKAASRIQAELKQTKGMMGIFHPGRVARKVYTALAIVAHGYAIVESSLVLDGVALA